MIRGEQLREVMRLLEWSADDLADRADLRATLIQDGLVSERGMRLTDAEEARLRRVLGDAGIIILDPHRGDLGVRRLPV